MVSFTAWRVACMGTLRRFSSLRSERGHASLTSSIMAPWMVATRRISHHSKGGGASADKAMLAEMESLYKEQLDTLRLMRAMLDDDIPEELAEQVNEEVAKLEAELEQLKTELDDRSTVEPLVGGLVRSWTYVELASKHGGIQLAQHNRIADTTGDAVEEYGDFLWTPAIALARWLAQESSIALDDKTRVLELGAGFGLPGITAATLGARQVLIQDQLAVSLQEAMATAARNGVEDRVSTLACAWEDLGRRIPNDFRAPDIVLGSCLLYERDTSIALAGLLSQILKHPANQVGYIVAAEWEGCQDLFMDHCQKARLAVERTELHTWVPDSEKEAATKHAMFTIRNAMPRQCPQ